MAKHDRRTLFSLKIVFVLLVCCSADNRRRKTPKRDVCAKRPSLANGKLVKLEVIHGAKVAWYECNVGFIRDGPEFRMCRQGRGWSSRLKCKPPSSLGCNTTSFPSDTMNFQLTLYEPARTPPTTPTTPVPKLKKAMAIKLQKDLKTIAKDMEEIEGTREGRALTIAIVTLVLVIVLLAVHCSRVISTRKSLKAKYDEVVNAGDKPSREIPSAMVVSLDLFKTTCCCQDSELPKAFKKEKKKKKKKDVDETESLL